MTGPEAASDASRPSSGVPDTDGVPVKGLRRTGPGFPGKPRDSVAGRKPTARFHCREHFSEHRFRPAVI